MDSRSAHDHHCRPIAPGNFRHVVQSNQVSHGEAFYLDILQSRNGRDHSDLLAVDGTITITDKDGHEIQSLPMTATSTSNANPR